MNDGFKKQTVLIVDDAPANIKILGEAFKGSYKVQIATTGPKGLEIAMSPNPPDLILLDIVMPDMDGYEVCRRLKASKRTQNIPIIFITGKSEEADETMGLELGAVDYITKPFSLPIVKARVKTHMELKRHRDILENLSALDGLTGIPNRRRFDEFFKREWRRALREPDLLSMVIIDIDFFKTFNDNYGHGAGDDCLKKVARALARAVKRPMDVVARYGGEEFICMLPATNLEGALLVAETLRKTIEALEIPHAPSSVADYVTISLGAATILPAKDVNPTTLIEGADRCLYRAKGDGRNQVRGLDLTTGFERARLELVGKDRRSRSSF